MSIADAILAVAVLLLFLVILGVMRECVILRGDVTALSQLITHPPAPSFMGERIPRALAERLSWLHKDDVAEPPADEGARVILFLSADCGGCDHLVAQVREAVGSRVINPANLSYVVSATSPDSPIFQDVLTLGPNALLDSKRTLSGACEIRGTPSALAVWSGSGRVFDFKIGGDLEWIRQTLQRTPTSMEAIS